MKKKNLFILLVLCSLSICTDIVSNVLHWSMLLHSILHGHTIFKIFWRKIHFVFVISFHFVDIFLLALLGTTFSFSRYVDACYCAFQIQRVKSKHIEHLDKHFTLNERKTAANKKRKKEQIPKVSERAIRSHWFQLKNITFIWYLIAIKPIPFRLSIPFHILDWFQFLVVEQSMRMPFLHRGKSNTIST